MHAVIAGVSRRKDELAEQLALNRQVPLLHVGSRLFHFLEAYGLSAECRRAAGRALRLQQSWRAGRELKRLERASARRYERRIHAEAERVRIVASGVAAFDGVIDQAVAAAHRHLAFAGHVPCEADARAEIPLRRNR